MPEALAVGGSDDTPLALKPPRPVPLLLPLKLFAPPRRVLDDETGSIYN